MTANGDRNGGIEPAPAVGGEDLHLEVARLRELVAVAETAIKALQDRCEDLEEYRAHLGRLCIASAQLHESEDPAESLRMRARPKVLMAHTYEEALDAALHPEPE